MSSHDHEFRMRMQMVAFATHFFWKFFLLIRMVYAMLCIALILCVVRARHA